MKLLRDITAAARRLPLPNGSTALTPASLLRGADVSSAASIVDNVLGPALGGHGYGDRSVPPREASPAHADDLPVAQPGPAEGRLRPVVRGLGDAGSAPAVYQANGSRAAVFKAGQQHAHWRNTYVSHAMPAVLQLQRQLEGGAINQPTVRSQLSLEVRYFRDRLSKANCDWNEVTDASYLLCTYLDEVISDAARSNAQIPYDGDRSLLVEFHGDAWGGEDAFADLERWMALDRPPLDLLALYEMILSLGWQGRYRVLDRGEVLLQDLRSRLHALIWQNRAPDPLGTPLILAPASRPAWWTVTRASLAVFGLAALAYVAATLDLDARGRPVREALAAWAPPVRTVNIAETLPPPLPQLLSEGWLTAYKHPLGWLLVFKSDGAFDVGKAVVRPQFMHNIERLGLGLAPWPGDLEVIGHTDALPVSANFAFKGNQGLSEARAENVAEELRQSSVAGGARAPAKVMTRQISFSGRGESEPVDPTHTPAAFERNRRVEVLWKVVPTGRAIAPTEIGAEVVETPRRPPVSPAAQGATP